jgi:hypothetical protein
MSFLAPLMSELLLGTGGAVLHKIEQEFKPIIKERLTRTLTSVVSSQIAKDGNGIVANVVKRSSKNMRSCACHRKSSGRKIG